MSLYAAFSKHTIDKEAVMRPLLLDRILLLEMILWRRLPQAGILLFNRGLYVEQAEAIRKSFPHVKRILFLLGFDKIVQILAEHYYQDRDASLSELFKQAELLVAPRGSAGDGRIKPNYCTNHRINGLPTAFTPLPFSAAYRNISSTAVRHGEVEVLSEVPNEVRRFMRETRAYAPPYRNAMVRIIDYYGSTYALSSTDNASINISMSVRSGR